MEEKKYSTDCNCKHDKPLKGIVCDAQNCAYNDGSCKCCASQICVGPREADCSGDTACTTFKPRTY